MKTLKKVPNQILLIDPHLQSKIDTTKTADLNIKILQKYEDLVCIKKCICKKTYEPELIILVDYVLHFKLSCYRILSNAQIYFVNKWNDNILNDALEFYSNCEIRNGL